MTINQIKFIVLHFLFQKFFEYFLIFLYILNIFFFF